MKTRWKIARIAGIDLYLHTTFPLLLVWVIFYQFSLSGRLDDVWLGLLFTFFLFALVVAHEFGHALMARRFGITTRDITLFPIGGVARLTRIPTKPLEELLVALAGPAVNVVLAVLLFFALDWRRDLASFGISPLDPASFLQQLARANLWLAVFNLLPAFPLDGGRVLRALLSITFGRIPATHMAIAAGRGIAIILGLVGLALNPFLVRIAIFIWIAGKEEADRDELKAKLGGVHVEQVMLRECRTFFSEESLARVTNHLLACAQEDYPVIDHDNRFIGLLRRSDLVRSIADRGPDTLIGDISRRTGITAHPTETVTHLLERWPAGESTVAVLDQHRFVGMFTTVNLGEFMLVQSAMEKRAGKLTTLPSPAPFLPST